MEELSAEVNKVSSIYSISTDYDRILKVLMVSKIVPLKRIFRLLSVCIQVIFGLFTPGTIAILVFIVVAGSALPPISSDYPLLGIVFCITIHQTVKHKRVHALATLQLDIQQVSFLQSQNKCITLRAV